MFDTPLGYVGFLTVQLKNREKMIIWIINSPQTQWRQIALDNVDFYAYDNQHFLNVHPDITASTTLEFIISRFWAGCLVADLDNHFEDFFIVPGSWGAWPILS